MKFSKEYWSGLPFPSPGDLPDPGIKPESPTLASSKRRSIYLNSLWLQMQNRLPRGRIFGCWLAKRWLFIMQKFLCCYYCCLLFPQRKMQTERWVKLPTCILSDLNQPDSQSCRRRQWQPTPVLLPGKSHGQRSLVGCSPWGR